MCPSSSDDSGGDEDEDRGGHRRGKGRIKKLSHGTSEMISIFKKISVMTPTTMKMVMMCKKLPKKTVATQ